MTDPILVALIAGVSAIIGGVIAALARPLGEDWVARRAEKRAAPGALREQRKARIERVGRILAGVSVEGPNSATAQREWGELPTAVQAVNDPVLTRAIQVMLTTDRYQPAWSAALGEAKSKVGELLASL